MLVVSEYKLFKENQLSHFQIRDTSLLKIENAKSRLPLTLMLISLFLISVECFNIYININKSSIFADLNFCVLKRLCLCFLPWQRKIYARYTAFSVMFSSC